MLPRGIMKYEQIRNLLDVQFRRLTGVKRQTFEKMLKILEEADKNKKIKGGRKNKLSLENQLYTARGQELKVFCAPKLPRLNDRK
jgi:hypothetical protein